MVWLQRVFGFAVSGLGEGKAYIVNVQTSESF